MNRPIKFRGKSIFDERWLYGDLVHSSDMMRCAILVNDKNCYDECEVISSTIGQFTGLYDKNGKEIYEGDIVRQKDDSHLYVVIIPHMNVYYASIEVRNGEVYGGFPLHPLVSQDRKSIEIMDNIHDNSELLKGGEK